VRAAVLGDLKLAGGEVEQADPNPRVRSRRLIEAADRQQERRLTGVEIAGIGQRPGRDDPHYLAFHDPLGLARVLDLLADGHPVTLLDQAGDIAVGGVVGHPTHRDRRARGVLGARRQGEIECAGRDQRVLVEQFVEVAHAEQHQSERILSLGLEVLPHGRRHGRTGSGQGRRGIRGAGQQGLD
jgi:hypothetical protein